MHQQRSYPACQPVSQAPISHNNTDNDRNSATLTADNFSTNDYDEDNNRSSQQQYNTSTSDSGDEWDQYNRSDNTNSSTIAPHVTRFEDQEGRLLGG